MHYFQAYCTAPACDSRFYGKTAKEVEELLDRHFTRYHPERYHTKLDLPMVEFVRLPEGMETKMFPKSYERAFMESMR